MPPHAAAGQGDKGRVEFISLYASTGRGLSNSVKLDFPDLIPASKPEYSLNLRAEELSESWLSGYFSVYCNFERHGRVNSNPHPLARSPEGLPRRGKGGWKLEIYDRVVPEFNFSRTISEKPLLDLLASYFDVKAAIRRSEDRVDISVYGIEKSVTICNLFLNYPLSTLKQQELLAWAKIVNYLKVRTALKDINNMGGDTGSLSRHMPEIIKLIEELNKVRSLNN